MVALNLLREEILAAQRFRNDLIKWKMAIAAIIGACVLGLNDSRLNGPGGLPIIAILIPFACLYVDAVCVHQTMRTIIIGRFLRTNRDKSPDSEMLRQYEEMAATHRSCFRLETLALQGSTMLLSAFVVVVGVCLDFERRDVYYAAGAFGLVGALYIHGYRGTVIEEKLDAEEKAGVNPT